MPAVLRLAGQRVAGLAAFTALGFMFTRPAPGAGTSSGAALSDSCVAFDERAAAELAYLDSLATSLDPEQQEWRDTLRITRTTSDSVSYVVDEALCGAARAAIDLLEGQLGPVRPLYVFMVGSYFAVLDPTLPAGESTRVVLFTRAWEYVAAVVGG